MPPLPEPPSEEQELRVPPHNMEAEWAILGAILLEPEVMDTAADLIRGNEFYVTKHQQIFKAMLELYDAEEPIDLVTVTSQLQDSQQLDGIGGVSYLSKIADHVPTAANFEFYAGIVKEKYNHREAIRSIDRLQKEAWATDDPSKLIALMQHRAEKLASQTVVSRPFRSVKDVGIEFFESLEKASSNKDAGGITGIPSGFRDLDRVTAGFQRSDLIIVAARPSVGKTAFALNIAQNVAIRFGEDVAIFSLEMGAVQLMGRMVAAEGNVDAGRMRTGELLPEEWEKVTTALGVITSAPIHIDDTPTVTVNDIRAKCRALKKDRGGRLGLILIDYLQLITGVGRPGTNRQEEVSHISRTLKQIARELDVPVIALSQLSRGVEQRQDKRPMMSDLRESGSIEQDADIVAFLYRDDYYNRETEKKNIIEIIIAKQRNGPVGTVELAFLKQFNKFANLDRSHEQQQQAKAKPTSVKERDRKRWA
ncbi:replicative DNA helicase [Paenibacillus sp. GYB004]|uniref:replicative DNA helicase n=1 Tax=Paenibacillus sp. GYB004 TaxID=2994393 RepID=UPI002F9621CC